MCRFTGYYNGIKKITVWKLVARNEDAFDRVRCLHLNKCHTNYANTSTITTYLKGLPRDLTNFFNFFYFSLHFIPFNAPSRSYISLIPFDCHHWSHLYFYLYEFISFWGFIWFSGRFLAIANYWICSSDIGSLNPITSLVFFLFLFSSSSLHF